MAKIFLVIKAWKINIISAALLKDDHLVSAGWDSWTPKDAGSFLRCGMAPGQAASVTPGHACRSQRSSLPAAHELSAASGLSICSMGAPKMFSKLMGTLDPSLCPVVTLPALTFNSALLVLPMPCSWGSCWVANPTQPPHLIMRWLFSLIQCSRYFPSIELNQQPSQQLESRACRHVNRSTQPVFLMPARS